MMLITKLLKKTTGEDNKKTEMYEKAPFAMQVISD